MSKETPGFSPPVTARVYGYSGLALYEAVWPGMPGFKSMEGQVTDLAPGTVPQPDPALEYHWGAVANATLSVFLKGCFQNTSQEYLDAMDALEIQYEDLFRTESEKEVIDRYISYGYSVGNAMIEFANTDGQSQCYTSNFPDSYLVPVGEGLWEPTSESVLIPLQPYWGDVRPFRVANIDPLLLVPPPDFSTDPESEFYLEAYEVYETVNTLDQEETTIAEFWSDDPGKTATPPGHSYSIMIQIMENEQVDLAEAAAVYTKLGMGVHDAFISCWNAKYHYNLIRPITYIHEYIDNSWTIPLSTPPFPEYTSGHSVQSGATAKILTDVFGENYTFDDYTHVDRDDIDGTPRHFDSFYDFADEAAISRLYGGIHYRAAIEVGVDQGIKIGANIGTLEFQ